MERKVINVNGNLKILDLKNKESKKGYCYKECCFCNKNAKNCISFNESNGILVCEKCALVVVLLLGG